MKFIIPKEREGRKVLKTIIDKPINENIIIGEPRIHRSQKDAWFAVEVEYKCGPRESGCPCDVSLVEGEKYWRTEVIWWE